MLEGFAVEPMSLASPRRPAQPGYVITGEMIRAARALLHISPAELARRANISLRTLHTVESAVGVPPVTVRTLQKLITTLQAAGIEFLQNSTGIGVRLRR